VYAHLVCPDFRKARLLTFSATSNRSYTKRDEHTHPSLLPTHKRFSDCLATHMHIYIYYSTKGLILLCFFPFSFSLNPYERNVRRTSTPQERRQRTQHCNCTLITTHSSLECVDASVSKREETKRKHEKEKNERERARETDEKERSKERGNKSALFYFNLCCFCA